MSRQRAESPIYQSYLVRLWRDKPCSPWRVSIQSTATEEMRHFATLDEYWSYLRTQLAATDDDSPLLTTGWESADSQPTLLPSKVTARPF